MALEVSSAGAPNADAAKTGTIAYTIGTRSVNTVLRLKDGQTEVIGGLIQDEDTSTATRIPGFGDIPILGRLFGKQTDGKNKKEIIMSITPRIIRNNRQVDSDLLEMWSGTENNMRFGNRQAASSGPSAPSASPTAAPAAAAPLAARPARAAIAAPAAPVAPPAPVNLLAPVPMLAPEVKPAVDPVVDTPDTEAKPAQ
jgi:general secretion pathway protein D